MNSKYAPRLSHALMGTFFAAFALCCGAQDVVKVSPVHNKIKAENADVRVIEATLAPGEKEGIHTHPAGWLYVTHPGTLKVVYADGKVEMWSAKAGESEWSEAERSHTSENIGKTTVGYVLIEVKSAAKKNSTQAPASTQHPAWFHPCSNK